jgi:hypothetical protein
LAAAAIVLVGTALVVEEAVEELEEMSIRGRLKERGAVSIEEVWVGGSAGTEAEGKYGEVESGASSKGPRRDENVGRDG